MERSVPANVENSPFLIMASSSNRNWPPYALILEESTLPKTKPMWFYMILTFCSSLSYVEMRVILARIIWNLDLSLAEESQDWVDRQKV